MDFYDFAVQREWHNIDLIAVSEENQFVLCVENKIDTGEHDGQLQKYFKDIEARYKDFDRYYFKLSITGCLPEENIEITREHWQIITYIDILNALKSISKEDINKSKDITKNIVKDFINNLKFCLKVDDSMMLACLK